MIGRGESGFVRLYAVKYFELGLSQQSVDALINHGIFPGNLRAITNKQILELPGFNRDDITKLDLLRSK